jgi:hypothetical protein
MLHFRFSGVSLAAILTTIALPAMADPIQVSGTSPVGTAGDQYYGLAATSGSLRISGTPETSVEAGKYYSFKPTVVAPSGVTLGYAIENKPSWAHFSAESGLLYGTPTEAGRSSDIVVTVSDGSQRASLSAFSVTVDPALSLGSVELSWSAPTKNTDGTPLTNLAGYVVRYGTSSSAMTSRLSVKSTKLDIEHLTPGIWYFEVAAVNSKNVESGFTPRLSETVR